MIWVDIAVGSAASATALSIIGTIGTKLASRTLRRTVATVVEAKLKPINDRFDANDAATVEGNQQVADLKLELAKQFGGNSGGMRQAINELAAEVAYVKGAMGLPPKEH